MEKYQIKVNNTTLNCDSLGFEYSQLDSESSGRSEDGTMHRDVIGTQRKIYATFNYVSGSTLTNILNLADVTSASVTFYDPKDGLLTKQMYITCDKINVLLQDGVYIAEPFEMRFIQMALD